MENNEFGKIDLSNKTNNSSETASKSIEETISKLDKVFKMRDKRHENLDILISRLREKNQGLHDANNKIMKELNDEQEKFNKFQAQVEKEKRDLISQFESEKQDLSLKIDSEKSEKQHLKSKLSDAIDKNASLSNKVDNLNYNLENSINTQRELEVAMRNLEGSVEERVRRVSSEAERIVHQNKAKHESEQRRLKALLNEKGVEQENLIEEHKEQILELNRKFEFERRRNDEIVSERDYLKQEISRLYSIVKSVQSTVDQLLSEEMKLAGNYENSTECLLEQYNKNDSQSDSEVEIADKHIQKRHIDISDYILTSAKEDFVK
jgi:chromosome segregation ATPase